MFSQLPPGSPIRDGRMEQFVEHCCDHCHCCKCKTIISLEMRNEFRKRFKLSVDPSARFKSRYNCTQGCIICSILPSGMGARGVSSEHLENREMFSCSPTQVRSDSQRTSKIFNICTCEHMILGQLTIGARQAKNAPLIVQLYTAFSLGLHFLSQPSISCLHDKN